MPKNNQKYTSDSVFGSFRAVWQRSFFVTLFFVFLAALLFWLEPFHEYQAETQILIIGKGQVTIDPIAENIAELSGNLSFYERLLANHPSLDDVFAGYTKDQRKVLWQKMVTVERNENSGVLTVLVFGDTPEQAKEWSEATVETLFSVASFYYNIKTDIDMRVVDEPIVRTTIAHPVEYVFVSLGSAFVATLLFFGILFIVPIFFGKKSSPKHHFSVGESVPYIDPRKFVATRPSTLEFEQRIQSHADKEQQANKAKAPANERLLPGMDASELPFQFEEHFPDEESVSEHEMGEPELTDLPVMNGLVPDENETGEAGVPRGEPTVEEYKRRLNELLSGGK